MHMTNMVITRLGRCTTSSQQFRLGELVHGHQSDRDYPYSRHWRAAHTACKMLPHQLEPGSSQRRDISFLPALAEQVTVLIT